MNPDAIVPFAYELIWYSFGALTFYAGVQVHLTFGAILLFGGIVGGLARNHNPDRGPTNE